jgi:type II secretory pathway predicted ATPase ExeA
MYKRFFNLQLSPFNVNPDPRFLFLTRHSQEALACLSYGIQSRKGFVLLTGEVGTGKTTIINRLLEWSRTHDMLTAFIFNPCLEVQDFFEVMMAEFGIACNGSSKGKLLANFNRWLLERYRAGQTAVLIVDEAQNLSPGLLEEVRLLTNLETSTEKLLQIVLSGQPELEEKLRLPQLRQLRQRITLRCKTQPFTAEETSRYVLQRLKIAGATRTDIFSPTALQKLHEYTCGVPRVINLVCEHALISALVDQKPTVTPDMVEQVAQEFELDQVKPIIQRTPNHAGLEQALRQLNSITEQLQQLEKAAGKGSEQ